MLKINFGKNVKQKTNAPQSVFWLKTESDSWIIIHTIFRTDGDDRSKIDIKRTVSIVIKDKRKVLRNQ
jgi:hypothetical protein